MKQMTLAAGFDEFPVQAVACACYVAGDVAYSLPSRSWIRPAGAGSMVKLYRGPPITPGAAAAAEVRLIVWCKACRHQVELDPAEMADR
jgi:hypothetical protein